MVPENLLSDVGVKCLFGAVFDPLNMNTISESNHQCLLNLLTFGDCYREWIAIINEVNSYHPDTNRTNKKLGALHAKESTLNYLEDVPVELMPEVLCFIQAEKDKHKLRNTMYTIIRWWDMPSLF